MLYYRLSVAISVVLFTLCACKKKDVHSIESPSITISTKVPDSVTTNSCISGGEIITHGSIAVVGRGVCWNTSKNPTASLNTKTTNKANTGSFSSIVFGLQSDKTYYLRAYVITPSDTLYGQEFTFRTPAQDANLILGQYHAGGIIFYLDNLKQHGLVCAPNDVGTAKWGCELAWINGTKPELGRGAQNTKAIVAGCSEDKFIAKVCDSVVLNFYDDWYMPSKDELQLIYDNVHRQGKGNFGTVYHSSTEYDNSSAWAMQFQGGNGISYNLWKGGTTIVRPVRSF